MHQIEVDDDVFSYLKIKAEPFIDSPNDVLRRELLWDNQFRSIQQVSGEHREDGPVFQAGTPEALKQILDVIYRVKRTRLSRIKATKLVAERYGVKVQTVNDKYGRQLCGSASNFDKLLEPSDCEMLKSTIVKYFPQEADQVNKFFKNLM
jgi:hypothetical protein